MSDLQLDPARTALLVMDYQTGIIENFDKDGSLLARTTSLVQAARAAGLRIVFVKVGFRPGYPEVSPNNKMFSHIKSIGRLQDSVLCPGLAEPTDVVVTKHRVGSFHGTDLDMVLRANGIDTLVLAGIATSGVVLSTLRHGSDLDYRCIVVRDCCADGNAAAQDTLMTAVFPMQAAVTDAAGVTAALTK